MNRCCHWGSCSLSAFKHTVSKRLTYTGKPSSVRWVYQHWLVVNRNRALWFKSGTWPRMCTGVTPHHYHTMVRIQIHVVLNHWPHVIVFGGCNSTVLCFVLNVWQPVSVTKCLWQLEEEEEEEAFYPRALSFPPVECTSSKSVLLTTNVPAPKRPLKKKRKRKNKNKPDFLWEKKKSAPSGVFPLTLPFCTCTESLKSSMCLSTQWRQCIASGASLQLRATSLQRTGEENCQH